MKNFLIKSFCLICFSLFLSGCYPFGPDVTVLTYYELNGQRQIKQVNHTVILGVGKEPESKTYNASYTPRSFGDEPANCFILSVKGSLKLESVQGSYQYYSENVQPLEVTWIGHNEALLFPIANIVGKPLPKRTEKSGEMEHGRYKVNLTYRLNGQDYQCHFDVDYETRHQTKAYVPGVTKGTSWN